MFKLDQPDPFDDAKFPQARPIESKLDNPFLILKKGDDTILRVNVEDSEALLAAHSLISGLAKCALVPAELENLKDILAGVIRMKEGGS